MEQRVSPKAENTCFSPPVQDTTTVLSHAGMLTASDLVALGLREISAFVPSERSPNAERVKRARKKSIDSGVGQVNVLAPVEDHKTIKTVAKALHAGKSALQVFENLLTAEARGSNPDAIVIVTTKSEAAALEALRFRLSHLSGLRRLIALWVGLI